MADVQLANADPTEIALRWIKTKAFMTAGTVCFARRISILFNPIIR